MMLSLLLHTALLVLCYTTCWYIIAIIKKRNDVADIAWGLGYVLLATFLYFSTNHSSLANLLYCLVTVWGIRLSVHIYLRSIKKGEDYRYKQWRDEWGSSFYIRSYLQVFLLQGVFLLIIASPLVLVAGSNEVFSIFTWIGLVFWVIGFFFQSVGDYQLTVFMQHKKSKAEIIQTGLWKYSRHPNYFGEIMMWWGIYIIIIPLTNSIWFIVSPLTITFLLVFVSGIPLLEKKYKNHTSFQLYKKKTSALVPWPPKKC